MRTVNHRFNKSMRAGLAAMLSLALLAGVMTFNGAPAHSQEIHTRAQFLHAAPGIGKVEIHINNNGVLDEFEYGTTSKWIDVDPGIARVTITEDRAGFNWVIMDSAYPITAGNDYNFVITDVLTMSSEITRAPLAAGMARAQIVHASVDTPAVDVAVSGTDKMVKGLSTVGDPPKSMFLPEPMTSRSANPGRLLFCDRPRRHTRSGQSLRVRPDGPARQSRQTNDLDTVDGRCHARHANGLARGKPGLLNLLLIPLPVSPPTRARPARVGGFCPPRIRATSECAKQGYDEWLKRSSPSSRWPSRSAIDPMRITAIILVLLSDRARRAGPLFLAGYVLSTLSRDRDWPSAVEPGRFRQPIQPLDRRNRVADGTLPVDPWHCVVGLDESAVARHGAGAPALAAFSGIVCRQSWHLVLASFSRW